MLRPVHGLLAVLILVQAPEAQGHEFDDLDFFAAEAAVVSASHSPRPQHLAPATVYVVTAEDIRASGAQTLWDALRAVPGVDVMTTRAFQGEVGIRGLNRALNNRTLVLLDGNTVLNGYADFVTWESIPVTLEEIERIEVVAGAVSALHGANAVNGVVNILTKGPQKLPRGLATYAGGQRRTNLGTVLVADHGLRIDYRVALGWRSTNQFTAPEERASEVGKLHGTLWWRPGPAWEVRLGGGFVNINTQFSAGSSGLGFDDGGMGFGRLDVARRGTELRAFWNRGRTQLRGLSFLQSSEANFDTYDVGLTRALALPYRNSLVVGGSYRRNEATSASSDPRHVEQDLTALFFENTWAPCTRFQVVASGRLDHHPLVHTVFSPRGSVVFAPRSAHTLRFSAGSSFRNPTLIENYLKITQVMPNPGTSLPDPPYSDIALDFCGNRALDSERLELVEMVYRRRGARLTTSLAGYRYRLHDIITGSVLEDPTPPPTFRMITSFTNDDEIRAWGGEWATDWRVAAGLTAFANYTYQSLEGERAFPRHKVNLGARVHRGGLVAGLWVHWVDRSAWPLSTAPGSGDGEVPSYTLVNGRLGYDFGGRLRGLGLGLSAFNLTDNRHAQILPPQDAGTPGQNGEMLRSRWLLGIAYQLF